MTTGLQTFKADGSLAFDSTIFTSFFYYGSGLPDTYLQGGRVSTIQPDGAVRIGARYFAWYALLEVAEKYISSDGSVHAASLTATYSSTYQFGSYPIVNLITKSANYSSFGSDPGTFPGFGIEAYNDDLIPNISVESKYATILESGSISVSSIDAPDLGVFPNWSNSGDQWFAGTATLLSFSRALINQPLIFISDVTGGGSVSIHSWVKDGSGLYTGVYLTSHQTSVTWNTVCSSYTGGTSCTVSYIIVDLDEPDSSPAFGIEIYDSTGTRIWNSDRYPINITYAENLERPYIYATARGAFTAPVFWAYPLITVARTVDVAVPTTHCVLLNSLRSITGIVGHYYYTSGDGTYYTAVNPYGEYLSFYESGGTRYARIQAGFTHNVTVLAVDAGFTNGVYSGHLSPLALADNPLPVVVAQFSL